MKSETKLKVGLVLIFCLFLGGGMYVIKGMVKDLNARDITRFMAEPAASYEASEDAVKKAVERYQQGIGPARLLARPDSSSVLLVFDGLPSKTDTERLSCGSSQPSGEGLVLCRRGKCGHGQGACAQDQRRRSFAGKLYLPWTGPGRDPADC